MVQDLLKKNHIRNIKKGVFKIKGIVLAGGLGTRLSPLTKNDNKHLLPVYTRRMIEYPILTLVNAGIKDIILITGGQRPGAFLELFKNGSEYGIDRLYYTYQVGNKGIADALKLAEPFIDSGETCVVILGDNYFENGIKDKLCLWDKTGCNILLKEVDHPWDFGVAELDQQGNILSIEEKPTTPKSNLAIVGCYMFDYNIWNYIDNIKLSARGELEITDVIKQYPIEKRSYSLYKGYWSDMGSFESWIEVSNRVAKGYLE